MSKLECRHCGHLILDVAEDLPYKAAFVNDADHRKRRDVLAAALAELIAARDVRERRRWFGRHFTGDFPETASDEDLVFHLLERYESPVQRWMLECTECGALYLQERRGDGRHAGYAPMDDDARGVLEPARARAT